MMANRKIADVIPTHSGENFSWKGSVGIADASNLGTVFAKKIEGSFNSGFFVKGKNSTKMFMFSHPEFDHEAELSALIYIATDRTCEIHILNT